MGEKSRVTTAKKNAKNFKKKRRKGKSPRHNGLQARTPDHDAMEGKRNDVLVSTQDAGVMNGMK